MEQDLLRDGAQAELLRDENLRLLAHRRHEEHERVTECLAFGGELAVIREIPVRLEKKLDLVVHEDDELLVRHARLQPDDLLTLLHDELLLRAHVLVRLLLEEQLLQDVEEAERIELEEVAQELLVREEAHDVVNVAPPLEGTERARWELLSLHEQAHHPEQLVADVRPTVLNI